MGFISDAKTPENDKLLAGKQVISWHDLAINSIKNAENYKQSLIHQLELMKTNNDYNQDDCDEAQGLIDSINTKLTSI